jgi:hypothetical protein
MRIAAVLALGLVIVVIAIEVRHFLAEGERVERARAGVQAKVDAALEESASIEANLKYFKEPGNLEKEMRARFNYRSEGEKLIILVPKSATGTASSVPAVSP